MDWTLVALALAFSGTYAFAGMRASRRMPAERRRRWHRIIWVGSALVVIVVVGLALTPDGVARWLLVAPPVAIAAWAVRLALRKHLGAEFLIPTAAVVVALALWAASNVVSDQASEPLFFVGVAILVIGSRIGRWRRRSPGDRDATIHP